MTTDSFVSQVTTRDLLYLLLCVIGGLLFCEYFQSHRFSGAHLQALSDQPVGPTSQDGLHLVVGAAGGDQVFDLDFEVLVFIWANSSDILLPLTRLGKKKHPEKDVSNKQI